MSINLIPILSLFFFSFFPGKLLFGVVNGTIVNVNIKTSLTSYEIFSPSLAG